MDGVIESSPLFEGIDPLVTAHHKLIDPARFAERSDHAAKIDCIFVSINARHPAGDGLRHTLLLSGPSQLHHEALETIKSDSRSPPLDGSPELAGGRGVGVMR
jgi:hypothetical protein